MSDTFRDLPLTTTSISSKNGGENIPPARNKRESVGATIKDLDKLEVNVFIKHR